jgi:alanyl-tRNA synthetase
MKSDKELKKELKKKASNAPDKYYATKSLKDEGFIRGKCDDCGTHFWSTDKDRKICGDSNCVKGFDVVKDNPCKNSLSYVDVWKKFKSHFEKRNYKGINRYPVVARWNPTTDFTIASIAAFQPFVVSGEIDPPAKSLVIPQFCLRFNDIDNVGVTGSHCTGFVMIGQHKFVEKNEWDINEVFLDIYSYLLEVIGLAKEELILHEDAWAGGGNFGPCMEFFSRGVELFNQVYMMFEQTEDGTKELDKKVLDMGLGMERIAWFSQGKANLYEAVFPKVLKKLRKVIHVDYDVELFQKFSKHSGMLNIDEVDDINKVWDDIAKKLNQRSGDVLKEKILPMTAVYSVVEHARALLVALNDGMLPSNVGGGYNLRVILRRALAFIDHYKWDIDIRDIALWHAEELKDLFPELLENIEDVKKILTVEIEKYLTSKDKASLIVKKIIQDDTENKKRVTTKDLIQLYDSQGIPPELIRDAAKTQGKTIKVPDNFYVLVAQEQETRAKEIKIEKKKLIISETKKTKIPETEILYYKDWRVTNFKAKVLFIDGHNVLLDKTYFYPTSGGQEHDSGKIGDLEISVLVREGKHVVHVLDKMPKFKVGDEVECELDFERRKQLTQHHSSAHIINAAARKVLGNHINQAGAQKKLKRAHLDITHFSSLTLEEQEAIVDGANLIIKQSIPINSIFLPRGEAEKKYGVRIYQGGVAPGKILRIVEIPGVEVEACGGTHLTNTSEAEKIVITSTNKISDGILRINFVAGSAAFDLEEKDETLLSETAKILNCKENEVPSKAEALFLLWKKARKAVKKGKEIELAIKFEINDDDAKLSLRELLDKTAKIFSTQPEHVPKTAQRFMNEMEKFREKMVEKSGNV